MPQLTRPAVIDATTGEVQYADNPAAAGMALAALARQQAQPARSEIPGDLDTANTFTQAVPGGPLTPPPSPMFQEPSAAAQPRMVQPSFIQAVNQTNPSTGMPVSPLQNPQLTKLGKLGAVLSMAVQGALAGRASSEQAVLESGGHRSGGAGLGFMSGYQLPFLRAQQQQVVQRGQLENQMSQAQLQQMNTPVTLSDGSTIPFWRAMQMGKWQEVQSTVAQKMSEARKNTAEAGAVPTKQALEAAQAEAANYKDDPNLGLIDLRTRQPVSSAGLAPLSAQEAAVLGKQPGDTVPLKLKNTANEIVNRGIRPVQAGGRSLLVDNQGNTIKDMGSATPVVVNNMNNAGFSNPNDPNFQAIVDAVGSNKMDLTTALQRVPPTGKANFMGALMQKYPDYFQGDFGNSKKVLEYFTSGEGGKNINAFNTATEHLTQLSTLATALDNKDNQTYNKFKNQVQTWMGKSAPTNFGMVKTAVAGEIGKTFKGNVTDEEMKAINANVSNAMSPQQLDGVIQQALSLMRSKMQANVEQYQQGRQGKPAFPSQLGGQQPAGSHPLDQFWK